MNDYLNNLVDDEEENDEEIDPKYAELFQGPNESKSDDPMAKIKPYLLAKQAAKDSKSSPTVADNSVPMEMPKVDPSGAEQEYLNQLKSGTPQYNDKAVGLANFANALAKASSLAGNGGKVQPGAGLDEYAHGVQQAEAARYQNAQQDYNNRMKISEYLLGQQQKKEAALASAQGAQKKLSWQEKQNQMNRDAAQKRAVTMADAMREKEAKKDAVKPPNQLPAADKQRIDNITMSLKSIDTMKLALDSGQNTVHPIGDNDFTQAARMFDEAIGRMQSGGAITGHEADTFRAMAPTVLDKKEMQQKKLADLKQAMEDRLSTYGYKREDIPTLANFKPSLAFEPKKKSVAPSVAGNQSPPDNLDHLSDEEIQQIHAREVKKKPTRLTDANP